MTADPALAADIPQAAIDAAELGAQSVLDALVAALDAEMAATGCYDVETLRAALTAAGREALKAAGQVCPGTAHRSWTAPASPRPSEGT
jgi:hypothetical protein